jgi:hypothetical protein
VKLIDEKVDGDKAIVHVSSERRDDKVVESSAGEITLTFENGQWKLDKEDWKSKIESK